VDVYIHVFLTIAVVGGEWSASRPGRYTHGERGCPDTHWIVGWVGRRIGLADVETRKILHLPGLEFRPHGRRTRTQSLYRHRQNGITTIINVTYYSCKQYKCISIKILSYNNQRGEMRYTKSWIEFNVWVINLHFFYNYINNARFIELEVYSRNVDLWVLLGSLHLHPKQAFSKNKYMILTMLNHCSVSLNTSHPHTWTDSRFL
jgi:hypothetical protein